MIKMSGRITKKKTLLAKAEFHKVQNELLALMEEGADRGIIRGGVNKLSDLLGIYLQEADYLG